jgi:hypothetical protein
MCKAFVKHVMQDFTTGMQRQSGASRFPFATILA